MPLIKHVLLALCFGVIADKFGMGWMIVVDHAAAGGSRLSEPQEA